MVVGTIAVSSLWEVAHNASKHIDIYIYRYKYISIDISIGIVTVYTYTYNDATNNRKKGGRRTRRQRRLIPCGGKQKGEGTRRHAHAGPSLDRGRGPARQREYVANKTAFMTRTCVHARTSTLQRSPAQERRGLLSEGYVEEMRGGGGGGKHGPPQHQRRAWTHTHTQLAPWPPIVG